VLLPLPTFIFLDRNSLLTLDKDEFKRKNGKTFSEVIGFRGDRLKGRTDQACRSG
jgi:hypothetical protein